ncbi:MAG TPA: DUF3105 domain-containing protein [Thermoleophilaceae bacterium]|nr:DUF3105 domain-containing protein [Thermoleophilaceae bacterium]
MASRREQKEQLRKEREQREAAAKAGQRRKQLIGYGVGGAIVLVAVIVAVALLAGGGSGGSSSASSDVLPDGGSVPEVKDDVDVAAAAKAAGCELKSFPAKSREHLADLAQTVKYGSKPPTSGEHYQVPAEDGAYEDPPDIKELVHTLEHGRIIVWFKKGLPADQRAALKAFYDEDTYQMVLVPDTSGMTYAVAATAWNRDPQPNGTGQLLGCAKFNDDVFTAIESFKDENRSRGPEPVP